MATTAKRRRVEEEKLPLYFDYNATTPIDPQVVDEMLPFFRHHFGNPSSGHAFGRAAKAGLVLARQRVATLLGCSCDEIVFLSGGTESINWALKGAALAGKKACGGNHIITSKVEHVAVLRVCEFLAKEHGFEVTYLDVDAAGRVSVDAVKSALRKTTVLVSLMLANNEVGTVQPVAEVAAAVKAFAASSNSFISVHSDASQAIGKIPVNVSELGVDFLTVAGHKLYAPKGVGALFVRKDSPPIEPLIHGAKHEHGRRAGTENVALVAGLGLACELCSGEKGRAMMTRLGTLRNALLKEIRSVVSSELPHGTVDEVLHVNGDAVHRLPNTLSLSVKGVLASEVLTRVQDAVALSAGSACHSNRTTISHVLKAMGIAEQWALGTLRLSVGKFTTAEEVGQCGKIVGQAIAALVAQKGR